MSTSDETFERTETVDRIAQRVYFATGIPVTAMQGGPQTRATIEARQIAVYLTRELARETYDEIGEYFNRDHAGMIHAQAKIAAACEADGKTRDLVRRIRKAITGKESHDG